MPPRSRRSRASARQARRRTPSPSPPRDANLNSGAYGAKHKKVLQFLLARGECQSFSQYFLLI